ACAVRALWDANPHRSPLHFANAGCAIGCRSQLRLASDRKLYGRHHWRHTAIDWQRMTRRGGEQLLDDCPVMARPPPQAATPPSISVLGCGFWATNIYFAPNASQGRICGFSIWEGDGSGER